MQQTREITSWEAEEILREDLSVSKPRFRWYTPFFWIFRILAFAWYFTFTMFLFFLGLVFIL